MPSCNVTHFESPGDAIVSTEVIAVSAEQVSEWKTQTEEAGRRHLEDAVVSQFRHGGLSAGVAEFLSAMAKIKGESR